MGTPAQRLESDRRLYPAMNVDEIVVWRAWLVIHQGEFDRFDYNVRLGQGEDPGESWELAYVRSLVADKSFPEDQARALAANLRRGAIMSTQLRIDAVGYQAKLPTIFEVKRGAGPSNIGQLLTYNAVWVRDFPDSPKPRLRLVCNSFTPNLLPAIKETGIILDQVDADFRVLKPIGTSSGPAG